jgi:hypothetical protein
MTSVVRDKEWGMFERMAMPVGVWRIERRGWLVGHWVWWAVAVALCWAVALALVYLLGGVAWSLAVVQPIPDSESSPC